MAMSDKTLPDSFQKHVKRKRNYSHINNKRKGDALPTAEEFNSLLEAGTMFHSNLFKLQMDELMQELKEKMCGKDELEQWLQTLKDFLRNIPESCSSAINNFTLEKAVQIPIIQTPESNKGNFKFSPPAEIKGIGSYALGTICSSSPTVDIAVEIPKVCWQGMDFLNHRYHRKRAFYLAYLAHSLLETEFVNNLKFHYQNECYLKPVLLINPEGIENVTVCLTAYPNTEAFKQNRFLPSKNNVRSSWFFGTDKDTEQPTPYYNASILSDLMLVDLNDYLKEKISSQSVKDGTILLKLWCKQRGLTMGYGRLNGFILTMFVAYLLKKGKITSLMSSYQIFRCVLLGFKTENLIDQGITLNEVGDSSALENLQTLYNVVFTDMSGALNMCYSVTKETCLRVQHEATLGLLILDKESPDSFGHLFMNTVSFSTKFEYILHLKGPKKLKKYVKKLGLQQELLDFGENTIACVLPKICDILKRGLNTRVSVVDAIKLPHIPWSVCEPPPNPNVGQVTIGFLLNPEVPLSNIEKGPVSEDPKAKEFRNFWGDRSEMRRFQDGSIREAVHWPASTIADRRSVFCNMITAILIRHIGAEPNHLVIYGNELNCVLEVPESMLSGFPSYGTGEEAHATIMQSFNSLSKELRALKDLPLNIASIQGSSPSFRFSEVFPPISILHKINKGHSFIDGHIMKLKNNSVGAPLYIPALKVIVGLEGSGKWPDNTEAIKRVKAAFHLKIGELVEFQYSLIAIPFPTHTDIFKDGLIFRIEVACHKEIFLMKQVKMPNGSMKIQENKDSRNLEISTEILPKLNSSLHGLHQQHNTYGTACRLAKRWISAQLKHGFIDDIAVELLIASIYIHPEPFSCPCSPQVAFTRFLTLLITHDWTSSPLIVNLNNELTHEEIEEINSTFSSQRSTLPAMVLATPFDRRGCMWTKNMPAALILKRIVILAEASLKSLDNILNSSQISDIKAIFRPPLNTYDVLIYLKRNEIPRLSCAVDVYTTDKLPVLEPYKQKMNEVYPIVDYDPVQMYLEELRENFGEFAYFLNDIYGGDFIAVVWKLSAFTPKEFKISNINCRTVCSDGKHVMPDVEAILEDFAILGTGLVKNIVKQTENWKIP